MLNSNSFRLFRFIRNFCVNIEPNSTEQNHINSPPQIKTEKVLKVAILGTPNAGKSTLINRIVGHSVCPVSSKVHTTKLRSRAVVVRGNVQILFVDTPGLVSNLEIKRHNLESSFGQDGHRATKEADIVGVIHDVGNTWTRGTLDSKVIAHLEADKSKKSFLVLNKVDKMKHKKKLLELTKELLKPWPYFQEVFMVSALKGQGVSDVLDYLIKEAHEGDWHLPAGSITDRNPKQLIVDFVRAHLLDALPQEVPYNLNIELEYLHLSDIGELICVVLVTCPLARHQKLVLGKGGKRIKDVAVKAEADLADAFQKNIRLRIVVQANDKK